MDERLHRVIIIDDEPAILSVLKEYIEIRRPRECVVETARDGSEGLDLLVRHRPDLVILDIDMPGPNGMVVLRKIHSLDPTIPVVMLTGKADAAQAGETLRDGAVMYAPKPLDLRYLDHLLALYCAPSS